jgi:hypothetical protein
MTVRWKHRILVVFVVIAGCGRSEPSASTKACPDPVAGCRLSLGDGIVTARLSEPPRALRPFLLEVDAPDAAAVRADFSMDGMEMLPNRYDLIRAPDGWWRARVVLPVCTAGRRDWTLGLAVDARSGSMTFSVSR